MVLVCPRTCTFLCRVLQGLVLIATKTLKCRKTLETFHFLTWPHLPLPSQASCRCPLPLLPSRISDWIHLGTAPCSGDRLPFMPCLGSADLNINVMFVIAVPLVDQLSLAIQHLLKAFSHNKCFIYAT